jgi:transferase CAF17, mitochondrial
MASAAGLTAPKIHGHYGRLWGRGYEVLLDRCVLRVRGSDATKFLQNLVTANLNVPPTPPIPEPADAAMPGVPQHILQEQHQNDIEFSPFLRSACFLDPRGRLVTDALLWKADESTYYIDIARDSGDVLLQHLHQYKLRRSKVAIEDVSSSSSSNQHPVSGFTARWPRLGLLPVSWPAWIHAIPVSECES